MYKINNLQILFTTLCFLLVLFFHNENSIIISSYNEFLILTLSLIFLIFLNKYFDNKFFEIFISFFLIFFLLRMSLLLLIFGNSYIKYDSLIIERNLDPILVEDGIKRLKYFAFILFISLILTKTNIPKIKKKIQNNFEKKIILLFCFIILFFTSVYNVFLHDTVENLSFVFQIFFNVYNWATVTPIIFVLFISYFFYKDKNKLLIIYLFLIFLFYISSIISSGSKSGVLYLILFFYLLFYLSNIDENVFVKKIVTYAPILFIITILLWLIGYFIQHFAYNENLFQQILVKTGEVVYISGYANYTLQPQSLIIHLILKNLKNFHWIYESIIYRIGYFDFYLDKSIFENYKQYININYYSKSLVDKISPGFDFFGVPLASRALYYAYHGFYSEITQSEQMTMFAESYAIFGKFYFIYYLILVLFIKLFLFINSKFQNLFIINLSNFYIVYFYFNVLTGFGLDTHIMELIFFYIIIFSLKFIINLSNKIYLK